MKIAIVGCGKIGLLYARSFVKHKLARPEELLLAERNPERIAEIQAVGFQNIGRLADLPIENSDLVLISVKPQNFPELAPEIRTRLRSEQLVLSVMAGVNCETLREALGQENLVRAMPNTPLSIDLGATGVYFSPQISQIHRAYALKLLSVSGVAVEVANESQMDAVTALSGSGPAFVFYLLKAMVEAGERMGFTTQQARFLSEQTMLGAVELARQHNGGYEDLIAQVASKGGTTVAGLTRFEELGLAESLIQGVLAAEARAKELGAKK